jgi:hypothetical protein
VILPLPLPTRGAPGVCAEFGPGVPPPAPPASTTALSTERT